MVEPSVPVWWNCGTTLRLKITHNRNGKAALTLWCGEDGRQLRALCNHRPVIEGIVARLEAQANTAVPPTAEGAAAAAPEAIQNASTTPIAAKSPKISQRAG